MLPSEEAAWRKIELLSDQNLDTLEWVKTFLSEYERKHKK